MVKNKNKKSVLFVHTLRRSAIGLFVFLGVFAYATVFLPTTTDVATAATNESINFQARLLRANGSVVPDGNYNVEFKIYNSATSTGSSQGSCTSDVNCLWTETRTTGNRVRVANGYLTVSLGSVTPFAPNMDWTQDLWLSMNIGDSTLSPTWDGPMTPRLKLTAVPYAMSAAQAARANTLQNATGFSSTLGFSTQTAARSILLPDENGVVCIQGSVNCGFVAGTADGFIKNGLTAQAANFVIQSANAVDAAGRLIGAVGQAADIFQVADSTGSNLFTVGATGSASFRNSTNSTNAFSIQNVGGQSLFTTDTQNNIVTIGVPATWDMGYIELADPTVMPGNSVRTTSWSNDGRYLAVGSNTTTADRLTIYKRSGDTFTKLADPASMPGINIRTIAWSTDGQYMSVVSDTTTADRLTIYKRSGDTFTKLADPASMPGMNAYAVAWSNDGQYLTVGSYSAGADRFTIYKRSGDTFTKLADPAVMPGTDIYTIAWSNDGQYLAIGSANTTSNRFTIYKRSGDTFTKLDDPAISPGTQIRRVAWSPDSQYLGVGSQTTTSNRFTIYKRSGDTFTKLADPAVMPGNNVYALAWSPDSQYISVGSDTTAADRLTLYKVSPGTGQVVLNGNTNFMGTAAGRDAVASNEFTTLGQVQGMLNGMGTGDLLNGGNSFGQAVTIGTNDNYGVNIEVNNATVLGLTSAGATITGNVNVTGTFTADKTLFKNTTNSTNAFDIQNATGKSLLTVDTVNNRVTIVGMNVLGATAWDDGMTKLADPATMPGNNVYTTAWSPDAQYLSVGSNVSTSDRFTIYKRSGDTFTKLTSPSSMPGTTISSTAWSPDGQYLSVGSNNTGTNRFVIYKRSGDTFTKLADPADMPGSNVYNTAWSPDGQYLSVGSTGSTSDRFTIYKRSGDTFTKLTSPASMPGNSVYTTAWSPDGQYLSVGSYTTGADRFTIYKRSGDTFTKLSDPSAMPGSNVYNTAWSPDGQYLSVGSISSAADRLTIYKRSGDIFTKLADPADVPGSFVYTTAWSPDGQYLSVGSGVSTASRFVIYKRNGDSFTKLPDPTTMPGNNVYTTAWSPDGQYLSVGSNVSTADRFMIYKANNLTTSTVINGSLNVNGRASGMAAVNDNEFTTLGQLKSSVNGVAYLAGDNQTFSGSNTVFRNTHNTTNAFMVQTANGTSLLSVNTQGSIINIGSSSTWDQGISKLVDPAVVPVNNVNATAWSPDGQYLGVAVGGISGERLIIYKRSGDTFTKLADPASMPGISTQTLTWSPNGQYLTVGSNTGTANRFIIYKRSGDTFTKLADPADMPAGNIAQAAFSPDGQYLTVGSTSAPYLIIYKRSGDTFTKLADPATMPVNIVRNVSWSPSGEYLSVGSQSSAADRLIIYKRSGDTFTKLADPATMPGNFVYASAWSPDGQYLSVGSNVNSSDRLTIYKRSGDTFTKLADPAVMPGNNLRVTSWSPDSQYLTAGSTAAPYFVVYKRSGDTFTKLADPVVMPSASVADVAFSPDNQYLSVGSSASPYLYIYKPSAAESITNVYGLLSVAGRASGQNAIASNEFTTLGQVQDLLANMGTGDLLHNGNSFGETLVIGTNDNYGVNFEVNNSTVLGLTTSGASINGGLAVNGDVNVTGTFTGNNVLFRNTTNSTTAFNIQNAGGQSLFTVDTLNNKVNIVGMSLNVTNDGNIGAWRTTTALPLPSLHNFGSVEVNGYVYAIGGIDNTGTVQSTVRYAKVNTNGNIDTWTTSSNPLPAPRQGASIATANGYIYVISGSNTTGYNGQSTVYYAKVNSDGSTSAWSTGPGISLALAVGGDAVVHNNYIYYKANNTPTNGIYYASLNQNTGALGSWNTSGDIVADEEHRMVVLGSYMYIIGGIGNSSVRYAAINPNGSLSTFNDTESLPEIRESAAAVVANGYIYVVGGSNGGAYTNTAYYAKANPSGGYIDEWFTSSNVLPATRGGAAGVTSNGNIYVLGGQSANTAYVAPLQKTIIGGTTEFQGTVIGQNAVNSNEFTTLGQVQTMIGNVGTYGILQGGNSFGQAITIGTNDNFGVNFEVNNSTVLGLTTSGASIVGELSTTGAANIGGSLNVTGDINVSGTFTGNNVLFRNTTNSTTAFDIQNAGGLSLFTVDTLNNKVNIVGMNLNVDNDGKHGSWTTGANSLPAVRSYAASTTANGYAYVMGGYSSSYADQATVYYAKFNPDGSTSAWTTSSSSLPAGRSDMTAVTAPNGYIYVLGGSSSNTVYYAKTNPDGSIGAWTTSSNSLPTTLFGAASFTAHGYIYTVGGYGPGGSTNTVYYAKVNPDGSTSPWATSSSSLPQVMYGPRATVYNGYVYVASGGTANVYYAKLNANGSIDAWVTNANPLPITRSYSSVSVANGYLYVMGGSSSTTVYYAKLNANGSTDTWTTSADPMPAVRDYATSVTANGYVYVMGGSGGGSMYNTVYYAALQRTVIGGTTEFRGTVLGQDAQNINEFTTLGQVQTMIGNVGTFGILQGGNSFGSTVVLGTNDAYGLNFKVGGTTAMSIAVGGSVTIGSNVTFDGTTGAMTLTGAARRTKKITLTSEYTGAVLDASNDSTCAAANSGTLSAGLDLTSRMNYYNWSSTSTTAQCYNVVVQVPLPSDFDSWATTTPLAVSTHSSNTGTAQALVELRDSTGAVIYNYVNATPGAINTWNTSPIATNITGTYSADSVITLRIRVVSSNNANIRIGNITFNYLSRY